MGDNYYLPELETESLDTDEARVNEGLSVAHNDRWPPRTRQFDIGSINGWQDAARADNPELSIEGFNNVISGKTVTVVADPFAVWDGSKWHAIVEVNYDNEPPALARATSVGGIKWTPQAETLNLSQSLAYPLVWRDDGTYYMTPDRGQNTNIVQIYTTDDISNDGSWTLQEEPINPDVVKDPTPFHYDGRWWIIYTDNSNEELDIWYSNKTDGDILGLDWTQHPQSPYDISGIRITANGGRALPRPTYIDIPFQLDNPLEMSLWRCELDTSSFSLTEYETSPIFGKDTQDDQDWRAVSMHHMDFVSGGTQGQPFALVDGSSGKFESGVYVPTDSERTHGRLELTHNQTIAGDNSWNGVEYDSWDHVMHHEGIFGIGSSGTVATFSPKESGYYRLKAQAAINSHTTTGWKFGIQFRFRERSNSVGQSANYVGTTDRAYAKTSITERVNAGENVEVRVRQNSGNSNDLDRFGLYSWFEVERVDTS